jgi:hypothetical protein
MTRLQAVRTELQQLGFEGRRSQNGSEVWIDPNQRRRVVLCKAGDKTMKPSQAEKIRKFRRGTMVYVEP